MFFFKNKKSQRTSSFFHRACSSIYRATPFFLRTGPPFWLLSPDAAGPWSPYAEIWFLLHELLPHSGRLYSVAWEPWSELWGLDSVDNKTFFLCSRNWFFSPDNSRLSKITFLNFYSSWFCCLKSWFLSLINWLSILKALFSPQRALFSPHKGLIFLSKSLVLIFGHLIFSTKIFFHLVRLLLQFTFVLGTREEREKYM